jgi:hypothetical protein
LHHATPDDTFAHLLAAIRSTVAEAPCDSSEPTLSLAVFPPDPYRAIDHPLRAIARSNPKFSFSSFFHSQEKSHEPTIATSVLRACIRNRPCD